MTSAISVEDPATGPEIAELVEMEVATEAVAAAEDFAVAEEVDVEEAEEAVVSISYCSFSVTDFLSRKSFSS